MQIKRQLSQSDPLEKKASEDPNITCAWDLGRMLEAIAAGTLVSEQTSKKIVQIMAGQRLGRLKNLLPCTKRLNPYAEKLDLPPTGSVVAACKGGTLNKPGIAHDAGIFYLPDGRYYVMVMCTQSSNIKGAIEIIEKAGLLMYEAMK